ncbi:MAG: pyridoxal-dependent decarboxylase [Planctomycetota bacterium]
MAAFEPHPDPDAVIRTAAGLVEEILAAERAEPVKPTPDPASAVRDLGLAIPTVGLGDRAAIDALRRVMLATPTTAGPAFFNQLFGGREPVATVAEIAKAVVNSSMYTYKAAGVQVLLEQQLIDHMLAFAGWEGGDGLFTPGGSMSNMAAMIIGRNEMIEGARERGLTDAHAGPLGVYVSEESHYSVRKSAGMIGLGRDSVRFIDADARGKLIPAKLNEAIERDLAEGIRPVMIIATSGTTVMGAFDPIGPLADISERHGLWLHVDGAFGGTALLSPEHRHLMSGLDRADSFTWDAHKMMGVPLVSSVCLTREPGLTTKHFDESASYLFQQDSDDLNPGTRSIQCGRPNEAIKLWALWQSLGDEGYAARTNRQMQLAAYAADLVRSSDDMVLSVEPEWVTICFEVRGKPSDAICEALDEQQLAKLGFGIVKGRRVIRLVTVNPHVTEADLDRLFETIRRVAAPMPEADNAVLEGAMGNGQ